MSRTVLQGEDLVVTINGKTMLHATSHTFTAGLELKDFRTIHTNGLEHSPGDVTWSLKADGVMAIDDTIIDANASEVMLSALLAKTKLPAVINTDAFPDQYEGYVYVTSFEVSGSVGDDATYSITLTGDGDLTK
ncbi:MAG: phage tail tube protein [Rikenellaceae bacterium]